MNWRSWRPPTHPQWRNVAGLDVGPTVCHLVILSGPNTGPTQVCCAECLAVPEAFLSEGRVVQPAQLGQWLRDYLAVSGHEVDALCMGLREVDVAAHEVTLAAGLSDEDVAFQLAVDVAEDGTEVCIDFQAVSSAIENGAKPSGDMAYQVRVASRAQVEVLQQVAKAAQLNLLGVFGQGDALQSTQTVDTLPTIGMSLALQCEVAFGLALCAWREDVFNFAPHRTDRRAAMRRAWVCKAGACVIAGGVIALGLMWWLALATQAKHSALGDATSVARAWNAANQAHAQAQEEQQRLTQQHQWLATQQLSHRHTLQWAQTLTQAPPGVWVSQLTQQGAQWSLQGEALTSEDAQVLVTQLKALDIWHKPPELSQRQTMPTATHTALPVWQFQVEAVLKGSM